jgi:alpha-ketoglutarate-dependent taurine dioxygenase
MEAYMSHVISFLHSRVRPDVGGDTHFIDLVEGWEWFKANRPELAEKMRKASVVIKT